MDFTDCSYYKFNRIFLSAIKLWVYDNSFLERVQRLLCTLLLASGTVVQITPYFVSSFRLNVLLKNLSYIIFTFMFVLKYGSFSVNVENVKNFYDRIEYDWNKLQNEEELRIIRKYAGNGRLLTLVFATAIYSTVVIFILSQFVPTILNFVVPLNESRIFTIPTEVEYFVDQKKYLFFILLHLDLVVVIGVTAIIATETSIIVFVQHSCGMFKIASYRIEHTLNSLSDRSEKYFVICAKLASAVEAHRRAMDFIEHIRSTFTCSYFVLLLTGVAAVSINLYRLTQALQLMDDTTELLTLVFAMIGQFNYVFIANYIGQDVIDHCEDVFRKTCDSKWYLAPPRAQKLLLFIMQRSMKCCVLVIGGVYIPCFEGFSAVSSASLSYFTAIYSLQ